MEQDLNSASSLASSSNWNYIVERKNSNLARIRTPNPRRQHITTTPRHPPNHSAPIPTVHPTTRPQQPPTTISISIHPSTTTTTTSSIHNNNNSKKQKGHQSIKMAKEPSRYHRDLYAARRLVRKPSWAVWKWANTWDLGLGRKFCFYGLHRREDAIWIFIF